MNGNLALDVSILAVMIAMYMTKQDDKFIIFLMVGLVSHMLITKDDHLYDEETEVDILNRIHIIDKSIENLDTTEDIQDVEEVTQIEETDESENLGTSIKPITSAVSLNQQSKTVSNGVFGRQLSTPQTNLTSSIFPKTSSEANGKLADSRGSFFKSLVS